MVTYKNSVKFDTIISSRFKLLDLIKFMCNKLIFSLNLFINFQYKLKWSKNYVFSYWVLKNRRVLVNEFSKHTFLVYVFSIISAFGIWVFNMYHFSLLIFKNRFKNVFYVMSWHFEL